MDTELALMAIHRKTHLTLREVAQAISMSYNTARNKRAMGTFPIPMAGNPLLASVAAVANYLDNLPENAADDA